MLSRMLLAFSLSLLSSVSVIGQSKSDREMRGLFGPVQTVQEEEADFIDGGKGFAIENVTYRKESWSYDAMGRELTEVTYDLDDGSIRSRLTNHYDERGRLLERRGELSPDANFYEVEKFTYDLKGNLIEKSRYDAENELSYKRSFAYDAQGHLLEEVYSNGQGSIRSVARYKYNEQGRRVETAYFNHDAEGNLKPYADSAEHYRKVLVYDQAGNETTRLLIKPDESLFEIHVPTYDHRGNELELMIYHADGSFRTKVRNLYEFDSKGNWTEKFTSLWVTEKGRSFYRAISITKRKITYFKPK